MANRAQSTKARAATPTRPPSRIALSKGARIFPDPPAARLPDELFREFGIARDGVGSLKEVFDAFVTLTEAFDQETDRALREVTGADLSMHLRKAKTRPRLEALDEVLNYVKYTMQEEWQRTTTRLEASMDKLTAHQYGFPTTRAMWRAMDQARAVLTSAPAKAEG